MEKIDLRTIDKSNWESFRFEEIASKVSETVDPGATDLGIYVGLEHLDAEDIHIRRKGVPADVSGGKLRCYPGDVIFGKRRAYQRKAAIVDFNGICSAHAFVLRAKPKTIDPRLFPFFLHSDAFMHRMVDISVGGLSPTINWSDLKHQEFLLPPKDQQAQLAELLWAMDEVIETKNRALLQVVNLYETLIDNLFTIPKNGWDYIKLGELAEVNRKSLKGSHNPAYTFKYLDIASIIEPRVLGEMQEMTFGEAPSRARRVPSDNSIILSLVRPYHKAFIFLENSEGIIASTGTAVVNVHDGINPLFVFHQFFSKRFLKFCEDRMAGALYPSISPTDLKEFKLAIPKNAEIQMQHAEELRHIDLNFVKVKELIEESKRLAKSLINQVF